MATKRTAWSNTELTISNVHSSSVDHICMNAIDLVFDTDGLVNSAKVIDDSSKVDYTKKNTTSISTYGEWPADFIIDMDIGSSPHTRLQDWAQAVVDAADITNTTEVNLTICYRCNANATLASGCIVL